jgi:hypothetical protein
MSASYLQETTKCVFTLFKQYNRELTMTRISSEYCTRHIQTQILYQRLDAAKKIVMCYQEPCLTSYRKDGVVKKSLHSLVCQGFVVKVVTNKHLKVLNLV